MCPWKSLDTRDFWVPSRDREQDIPHMYLGVRITDLLLAKMLESFYVGIQVKLKSSV